jgi:oligosaccharide translocation protein RFT1
MRSPNYSTASFQNDNLLKTVFSSALSLMAMQFISRLFTFVLNQSLLRLVSPQVFGTAAVQFELLFGTILFFSREGVRNALLRAWPQPGQKMSILSRNTQVIAISNLAILPFLLGAPLAIISTYLYGHFASHETRNQPYFYQAIFTYSIATILELMAEPLHNR